MDAAHGLETLAHGKQAEESPNVNASTTNHNNNLRRPKINHYKWWLRVFIYTSFLLAGQTSATLLGRLYFDKGGNSKWMATFVQSAGFPVIIPLLFFFPDKQPNYTSPSCSNLTLLYLAFGLIQVGDNLMYSYGLLYLPVSTYSLLCTTQLAFNAVFSFFLNSQKFTALVLNSLVLLTISTCLLGINSDNEASTNVSKGKYIIGFLCTVGASALYSLGLSLMQLTFEKVFKKQTFKIVLHMQMFTALVATCACVVGLFASGEWRTLKKEMKSYEMGRVSYVMTLTWTAITWQICSIGILGLVFEVSSLFSNVIGTLGLPLVPVFAVVFFHDKMNGVKVIALALSIWGFLSYIYQHYLDDTKASKSVERNEHDQVPVATIEIRGQGSEV